MDDSENTTIPPLVDDTKDEDDEAKITPKKLLGKRLVTGFHTVTDKSKGALQSAAHAAESLSKNVVTSAAKTVKQGAQRVTFPFKDTKKEIGRGTESFPITKATEPNEPTMQESTPPEPHHDLLDNSRNNLLFFNMTSSTSEVSLQSIAMDNDRMILWVVVASIAFMQTLQHLNTIVSDRTVPLAVVCAWMLVAFTVGMEFDGSVLVQEFKYLVLGSPLGESVEEATTEPLHLTNEISVAPTKDGFRHRNPVRFLQRSVMASKTRGPHTCLERSISVQEQTQRQMRFNAAFLKRLSQIGLHTKAKEEASVSKSDTATVQISPGEEGDLGSIDLDVIQATVLLTKMQAEPLCRLRGVDVFLTDCAEAEMSTHPFLLDHGLRKTPTFIINMMTQWGSILIYMELPDWVVDRSTCLVEQTGDADNVKALKRFLAGDDDYRRNRLKIIPELVEAPYPIRLLCSKDAELQIHSDGWLETTYYSHCDGCPTWEVNVDCMGNSAIRGMALLIKRYLVGIKADFALVISHPDEVGAVLGMWRFDHLNVNQYPTLPDRYEGLDESVDVVRANQLVKEASRRSFMAAKA